MTDFTRDEAIEWLSARGLSAAKRDWSMGESVVATSDTQVVGEIVMYSSPVYIHPIGGRWFITESVDPRAMPVECGQLREAVQYAALLLKATHAERKQRVLARLA